MEKVKISVVILTYNEELNIRRCLESVHGWVDETFVVDSYSTDSTLEIAKNYTDRMYQHKFEDYSKQRNWVLDKVKFRNEWVLFLDADELLTAELKDEIRDKFPDKIDSDVNGAFVNRRFMFMGKWLKHGGIYPSWSIRLFKPKHARFEDRAINEHLLISGKSINLENDIIHEDNKDISNWIEKHNKYSTMEAEESLKSKAQSCVKENFWGNQVERKRFISYKIWSKLPLFVRPFIYFFYRYFLRFGFIDGKQGFIYHILHALWFRFLIDVKYLELKKSDVHKVLHKS